MFDKKVIAERLLYAKLQDFIAYLGNNAILRMNVLLYHTPKNATYRDYYHREYQYTDKTGELSRKVVRFIDGFLTVENYKAVNNIKESISLRGRDLQLLKMTLVPKLIYIIENAAKIYENRDGKIYVNDKDLQLKVDCGQKSLVFKPGVVKDEDDVLNPCIEMYLNSYENMSSLKFNYVYELIYIINTFNIYTYASTMVNYFGNPGMNFNSYDIIQNQDMNSIKCFSYEVSDTIKDKREGADNKKGFFTAQLFKK